MAKHVHLLCVAQLIILMFLGDFVTGKVTGPRRRASCATLAQVSQELWAFDVNRLTPAEITLNYQSQVPFNTETDHASKRLFTSVDEHALTSATYHTFISLLNNYDPDKGDAESLTAEEQLENNAFLDAVLATSVMNSLLNYLKCKGIVNNQSDLRSLLTRIWLDFYPRSGTRNDSSGFEHIMVGEYSSTTKVNGFHNWLSFYLKEKAGQLNYHGYVTRSEPSLIGAVFKWNNRFKPLGSFFLGVSPEFDIALYTLCFLVHPNKKCPVVVNGYNLNIQTYSQDDHIATAYVDI